jgi:hypothetical protein
MTISTTTTRIAYDGNGATNSFAVPFPFFGGSELEVIERGIASGAETTLTLGAHYTVAGGDGTAGTVTAAVAPATGLQWVIRRKTARTQSTDYTPNDPFPAETHEKALDRLTMIGQELGETADRALKFPKTDSTTLSSTLPPSVERAGRFLVFDGKGNPAVADGSADGVAVSSFMATVLDDSSASVARATLGVSIGSNVQAWDADLDIWATKAAPSGTPVGTSDVQSLSNKTLIAPALSNYISFPIAQSPSAGSNDLDDYEEGTWTPSDLSGASLVFANGSGNCQYVKIGQMVFASFYVTYPATASGLAATIGGLPFTSQNTTDSLVWTVDIAYTDFGAGFTVGVIKNDTKLAPFGLNGSQLTNSNLSGKTIRATAIYRAAA